ncbi:Histidinol-phosphatase [bioreactor metagenome]|uniref:histidinol-phosphatase n=1 Tax=bioreactor metagenome TaxID=1076179 RepID=A0A644XL69_9ZZZZ
MYLADSHTHSRCSPDGFVPMPEMAAAAEKAGLSCLTITDHCDLLALDGSHRILSYDWSPVLLERKALLDQFGDKLSLPFGLEFGMGHLDPEAAHRVLSQPGIDFVIGSIHNHQEKNGGTDFFYGTYTSEAYCHETLDDYFGSMEALAPTDVYDVLGHVIYPLRYMERDGLHISLNAHLPRIRSILRTAVEHGHGMEVNTFLGRTLAPWREILALYKEAGGEIITVGSDAHRPEGVGGGIPEAYDLLRDMGFRYIATYEARVPQFHKL